MNTASSSGDDDPLREARAYNDSIYLMAAAPYLLLGTIGLMIYRGHRAAQKKQRRSDNLLDDGAELPPTPETDRE
jgi:hypothetical protein